MTEWIKCSERMPKLTMMDVSETVLVVVQIKANDFMSASREMHLAHWDGERWQSSTDDFELEGITHWAVAPEYPS